MTSRGFARMSADFLTIHPRVSAFILGKTLIENADFADVRRYAQI
jgi:hypothetical protein